MNYPELHFNNQEVLGGGSGGSARNPKANRRRSKRQRIERAGSTKQRLTCLRRGFRGNGISSWSPCNRSELAATSVSALEWEWGSLLAANCRLLQSCSSLPEEKTPSSTYPAIPSQRALPAADPCRLSTNPFMGTFACRTEGSSHCLFSRILVSKVVPKPNTPFLDLKPC